MGRDGIAGLVCLAASLGLLAATIGLPGPNLLVPVGPGFYPRIVLGITAALALALIIADIINQQRKTTTAPAATPDTAPNYGLVAATFLIFILYVAALPYLGFRLSTLAFVAVLQSTLRPPRSLKQWIIVAITALVTTAVIYVMFDSYLAVLLPRGRWTDF